MKVSLKQRIANHARLRPTEVISGGEYERLGMEHGYKASNVGRRLRELENEGTLERMMIKGHVWYKWKQKSPQKEAIDRIYNQAVDNVKLRSTPMYKPKVAEQARLL